MSFDLSCIYSDRVEVWLLHAPVDKIVDLIQVFYTSRCSLLNFRKNVSNFSIRFQNNKLLENFIYVINNHVLLWSKIRGSCHDNNKREKPSKEQVKKISSQVFSQIPMWKKEQIRWSCELLPYILTIVKITVEGQNLVHPI